MEIRKITEQDIPALIAYGEKIYPGRTSYYNRLINFYFKGRISEYTGGLVMVDNNQIVGQIFHLDASLIYKGQKYDLAWGLDLIINEELRKQAVGTDIILANREQYPNVIAVGSGPLALKINLKVGYKMLGELRKYVGPTSLWRTPLLMLSPQSGFPEEIDGFVLIKDSELFRTSDFFNENLIEVGRDRDFIAWRYFTPEFRKYYVYQNPEGEFFVARTIKYYGIKMLCVVDFRCQLDTEIPFEKMFRVIKKLARYLRAGFILCGSSQKYVDVVLERHGLKSMGRPRPIIIRNELKKILDKNRVEKRDHVLVTLADSDGEVSWD